MRYTNRPLLYFNLVPSTALESTPTVARVETTLNPLFYRFMLVAVTENSELNCSLNPVTPGWHWAVVSSHAITSVVVLLVAWLLWISLVVARWRVCVFTFLNFEVDQPESYTMYGSFHSSFLRGKVCWLQSQFCQIAFS